MGLFPFRFANVGIKKDPDKKESCRGIRGGKVNLRVNFGVKNSTLETVFF